MANPHLSTVLDTFQARVHRSKDRLIAIPAASCNRLGLERRPNNHFVSYSIRKLGGGRWNHLVAKLTHDNEFAVPSGIVAIQPGDRVEVKLHRFTPDADALAPPSVATGTDAAILLSIAATAGEDPRVDGSERIDEELYGP